MGRGVYKTTKKNGEIYYRAGITKKGKHVSLGSFSTERVAQMAYLAAKRLYEDSSVTIDNITDEHLPLSMDKAVTILNHRDHGIYIKTPIYLRTGFFSYYLKGIGELKFSNDDLFYYSDHRILVHDGHIYVNDFGMQYGILARYGIKNFAVAGRDYSFANGDDKDYRYENIIVINKYHGVSRQVRDGHIYHEVKIHINGDFIVGRYDTDAEAAVCYNKAADLAREAGITKNFIQNYVLEYSPKEYAEIYSKLNISEKYLNYLSDYSS